MGERVRVVLDNLKQRWSAFEKGQKIKILVIAGALLAAIVLAIVLLTRTKYVPITSEGFADIATLSKVEAALTANNIPFKSTQSGLGVLVAEKNYQQAKSVIIFSDIDGFDKYDFSDAVASIGMSTTGTVVNETLLRVKISEVEQQIMNINGVTGVELTPYLPQTTNYFQNTEEIGTAAVQVGTSRQFTRKEGEIIANMVAASFKDLSKENVYVTDTNANVLYSGVDEDSYSNGFQSQQEFINVYDNETTKNIRKLLLGLGDEIQVQMHSVFDFSQTDKDILTVTNPVDEGGNRGFVDQEHTESSQGSNTVPMEEPGVGTNNAEVPDYQIDNGTQSSVSQKAADVNYLYNSERVVSKDNGYAKLDPAASGVTVMIYRSRVINEANITPEQLDGLTWSQYKEANSRLTSIPNETGLEDSLRIGTGIQQVAILTFERPVFVDRPVTPIPYQTIAIFVILAILLILLAYGLIKKTQPDEIEEVEPELTVEKILLGDQLEEEKEEEIKKLQSLHEIEFNEDSEIKKLIIKFVDEKPEAVAQLLRNWINEDWE